MDGSTLQMVRFRLDGMTCASCVARAERVLTAQDGVATARVNLADESAEVRFQAPATAQALAEVLGRAGYPVRQTTLQLSVEGMTCASCTGRVERVLKAQPGVASAVANLATRRAQVTVWDRADPAALAAAVTRAGYAAECPNVGKFLQNLEFTLDLENQIMGAILNDHTDPADAAKTWLKANPDAATVWLDGVTTQDGRDAVEVLTAALQD